MENLRLSASLPVARLLGVALNENPNISKTIPQISQVSWKSPALICASAVNALSSTANNVLVASVAYAQTS